MERRAELSALCYSIIQNGRVDEQKILETGELSFRHLLDETRSMIVAEIWKRANGTDRALDPDQEEELRVLGDTPLDGFFQLDTLERIRRLCPDSTINVNPKPATVVFSKFMVAPGENIVHKWGIVQTLVGSTHNQQLRSLVLEAAFSIYPAAELQWFINPITNIRTLGFVELCWPREREPDNELAPARHYSRGIITFEALMEGGMRASSIQNLATGFENIHRRLTQAGYPLPTLYQIEELRIFRPEQEAFDHYVLLVVCAWMWYPPPDLQVLPSDNAAAILLHVIMRKQLEHYLDQGQRGGDEYQALREMITRLFQSPYTPLRHYRCGARILAKAEILTDERGRLNSQALADISVEEAAQIFQDPQAAVLQWSRPRNRQRGG